MSAVIPTYNRAALLPRAIRSVLGQTVADLELIVVDDGSTDETVDVVRSCSDPRLRVVSLGENRGVSRARNEGIRAARGRWVAFLDSDDEWLPRKLERQLGRAREVRDPRLAAVYCRCRREDELTRHAALAPRNLYEGAVLERLCRGWSFPPSVAMVTRSALLAVGGFHEGLDSREDYDLWLRLAAASYHFAAVGEALVVKNHHLGAQLSADLAGRARAPEVLEREWGALVRERVGPAGYRRWQVDLEGRVQFGRFMQARQAMVRGDRREALRWCRRMTRSAHQSPALLAQALILATLGPRAYGALARAWHRAADARS